VGGDKVAVGGGGLRAKVGWVLVSLGLVIGGGRFVGGLIGGGVIGGVKGGKGAGKPDAR